ncbi:MAG: MFS transporter [Actinobacteria bacterium]|nr:MFS transporter [Actinomycetota bacterium]
MTVRSTLLGLAIALALADSSIVTLALPEILGDLDVGITTVAWVLTSFNLVLALLAVPAAYVARRRPRLAFAGGAIVFAAAGLACGLAPTFEVLVAARCVQAAGAALVVTAALGLLSATGKSEGRALHFWVAAGVFGAALGPAAGGLLTDVLGWESIFLMQVPLALVPLAALRGLAAEPVAARAGRPRVRANAGLLLVSGGLVAALFLIVLLLVSGWGMDPAAAGLVVTVMPLAAIVAARLAPRSLDSGLRIATGVVLVAGGLLGLAFLPRAGWAWTLVPQLLIGAGIGLTLAALTERAVAGRGDQVVHGGWTLAARHAGFVIGLLLLAPVLSEALERNQDEAVHAGTAAVLDSRIPALDKLGVAQDVLEQVDEAKRDGELPDMSAAFEERPESEEYADLISALEDQLDRAVTDAFSNPFLLAALLALAALVPLSLGRWKASRKTASPVLLAAGVAAALLVPYLALGGASFEPTPVANPCMTRDWRDPGDLEAVFEQIVLSALDGAACELGVSREELVLAVKDEASLDAFSAAQGISRADAERAVERGLERAVDDAEEAGALPGFAVRLVRRVVESVPPWLVLETLDGVGGLLP